VVAAVVVTLPFLDRPIALPVLARLWRKGGPTKTTLAREMVELLAAVAGRTVHVVGDGAHICTELRQLPPTVTLTGPMPRHASLWHVHPDLDHPPRLRRRGRPRVYGARIGTPTDLAASVPATPVTVTRYGRTTTVAAHHERCPWRGVFGARPVRVLVITEPGQATIALVTTDLTTRSPASSYATPPAGPSRSPSTTPRTPPASARPATAANEPSNAPSRSGCPPKAS
jgi:DDE superfamily endonuclease